MAARKTSSSPTRIWKFSARVAAPDEVHEVLWRANRYYNTLVAIERGRHGRFLEIRRRFSPELADLEDRWESLDKEIEALISEQKRVRQEHWRESQEARRLVSECLEAKKEELKAEQKKISDSSKELRKAFKEALEPATEDYKRRTKEAAGDAGPRTKSLVNAQVLDKMLGEGWPIVWKEIRRSDAKAHAESLAAREACKLATGTYLQVEEAVQRAKKDSLPRAPKFRRFSGEGKVSVQMRNGSTVADALAGTSKLSIRPAPRDVMKRGDQSRMMVVNIDQSVPRGDKVTLSATVKLHRLPPEDADIKWASLLAKRTGRRTTYELQLTLEHPSFAEAKRPSGQRSSEHVRIGWARVDGGVRVAHWPGSEVVVPDVVLNQDDHAASIQSAADLYFDRIKRVLKRWMRGGPHHLTAWHRMHNDYTRATLRRVCTEYAAWALGMERLGTLWSEWVKERKARGEDLYAPACVARRWLRRFGIDDQDAHAGWLFYTWARKDEHLEQYAADSRRRFQNRRDALFRQEAIRIATEFSEVTVDNYSIASLKELPSLSMPGDAPRDQAQHQAHSAAPGRFREILMDVMGPRCSPCERRSDGESVGTARKQKRGGSGPKGATVARAVE